MPGRVARRLRYLAVSPDRWVRTARLPPSCRRRARPPPPPSSRAQWESELWYCGLSLTAKLYLGGFLYSNVLRMSSFEEALEAPS